MPSKFDLGVPYDILAQEIANKENVTKKDAKAGLSLLSELNNISIDDGRVKVNPRSLIKTTDGRLVLCGARGPSLVEHLEQENLIDTETLNFGEFTFDILTDER